MATTYAGVTIVPLATDRIFRPGWTQDANIVRRHIPYAQKDNIQAAGRGNFRLQLEVLIEDDTGVSTLQAAVGATARTLADLFGTTYNNVYLTEVSEPRRSDNAAKWICVLEFEREGS